MVASRIRYHVRKLKDQSNRLGSSVNSSHQDSHETKQRTKAETRLHDKLPDNADPQKVKWKSDAGTAQHGYLVMLAGFP
jgi:hypothetical protein